jgi:hypothetical protein
MQLVALTFWSAYGSLLPDVYVQGNCMTGACLAFIQMCIVAYIFAARWRKGLPLWPPPEEPSATAASASVKHITTSAEGATVDAGGVVDVELEPTPVK